MSFDIAAFLLAQTGLSPGPLKQISEISWCSVIYKYLNPLYKKAGIMEKIVDLANAIVWSNALIFFLLGLGLYFSIRTGFLQIRMLRSMINLLFKGKSSKEGVSSFQAFALALSGRIGTGNIAGVATAIAWGGPGAVFWMWVIAFIGAATSFAETTLGQIYKEVKGGEYRGGPAYYMEKGMGKRWYALIFAITIMVSNTLFTSGIQSNSIAAGMEAAFNIEPIYSGILIAVLLSFVIFGGVHRIGRTAEIIVPFMAIGYILIALFIIILHIQKVPALLRLIVESAFGMNATFGGIVGSAISWGVKRGMYSNEAGQGTAPHAASAAEVDHPVEQGLVQTFSVYIDTLFVCTATAIIILLSGLYNVENPAGGYLIENLPGAEPGTHYTQFATTHFFPSFGTEFVAIALFLFAFTTLMALYYMAETNLAFLYKNKINPKVLFALRIAILCGIILGSYRNADLAWKFGDIGVGLTSWLNLIALVLLRKPIIQCFKDYERQVKENKKPVFNSLKAGIKNAKFWEKPTENE